MEQLIVPTMLDPPEPIVIYAKSASLSLYTESKRKAMKIWTSRRKKKRWYPRELNIEEGTIGQLLIRVI